MAVRDPLLPGDVEITERRLIMSIVEVTRHVFDAAAASIFLMDGDTGELIFTAVSGKGEGHLPGTRFPKGTGIAGWVAASGQPMIADDVAEVAQFARYAAESTGYVPRSIMAAPLIRYEECIGVLEVLDRSDALRGELTDVDLLSMLATQAACGLELLLRLRRTHAAAAESRADDMRTLLERIAARVLSGNAPANPAALKLLIAADELLA
ncbi:GAF domain-containing protein [Nonomuraea candida]|uniref:GAF domain-containing protein n=1 Tax=Nonomuraea candida TaxID=359159 RepID=UPI0006943530|nr:GAF domain-containing protein [Nonomuraea candida]